jgi:hypothetical protein
MKQNKLHGERGRKTGGDNAWWYEKWKTGVSHALGVLPLVGEDNSLKLSCLIVIAAVEEGVRCHTEGGTLFCIREDIGEPKI